MRALTLKDPRTVVPLLWMINGLPRSGQQRIAARIARAGGSVPIEVHVEMREGPDGWPIRGVDCNWSEVRSKLDLHSQAKQFVLFARMPLFTAAMFNEIAACHRIHMVRDPRQLFVAHTRQPEMGTLMQLFRFVVHHRNELELQPLWESDLPGLDLLRGSEEKLQQRLSDKDAWELYGAFYYIWVISLIRNLQHRALCVELRLLANSSDARDELIKFFAAFGTKFSLTGGVDRYAAEDVIRDLGLPKTAWGTRLLRRVKESRFAAAEARVASLLEGAADRANLYVDEEAAGALTSFLDPAYNLLLLPFFKPWFAKRTPRELERPVEECTGDPVVGALQRSK